MGTKAQALDGKGSFDLFSEKGVKSINEEVFLESCTKPRLIGYRRFMFLGEGERMPHGPVLSQTYDLMIGSSASVPDG